MDEVIAQLFAGPPGAESLTWEDVVLHLLLAFALSQVLAWVYGWTHRGMSYSRSQVHSLVLLAMIVTTVMLAVGNNIARAFGLFGALALIRFRTPVKDTRDTTFLFMTVGIGISLGTRNIMLAVVGTGACCIVATYLSFVRFGERGRFDATLRFAMPGLAEQEGLLHRVLQHYCRSFTLVHLREAGSGARMEFAYQVKLFHPKQASGLLADMGSIPGVAGINLLVTDEDEAG